MLLSTSCVVALTKILVWHELQSWSSISLISTTLMIFLLSLLLRRWFISYSWSDLELCLKIIKARLTQQQKQKRLIQLKQKRLKQERLIQIEQNRLTQLKQERLKQDVFEQNEREIQEQQRLKQEELFESDEINREEEVRQKDVKQMKKIANQSISKMRADSRLTKETHKM